MGWKGTMRTLQAEYRRVERESQRRQRELEREHTKLERMQEKERSVHAVRAYENHIEVLRTVHLDCGGVWDWEMIAGAQPPSEPTIADACEQEARRAVERYRPGLTDRLLNRVESRYARLEQAVAEAKKKDERNHQVALRDYEARYQDWEATSDLAARVLAGDPQSHIEVLEQTNPLTEVGEIGTSAYFQPIDSRAMEVTLRVHEDSVIPGDSISLLKSGKASEKKMPKRRFNELYQDYICGCALRVARELFALLPLDWVVVHAMGNFLNTQTGHMEEEPLLSAQFPRESMESLNFESLDPSDSIANFVHRMNFKPLKGFAPVDSLDPAVIRSVSQA
ncbi:hypothetical protein ACFLWA_11695 [Chloroflexota bacterium]